MQYYRIKQNADYLYAPVIADVIKKIDRRDTALSEAHKIEEMTIFNLAGNEKPDFIDLLSRQLFLVTEPLKETIKLYRPKIPFKRVILAHQAKKQQKTYYLPIFEPIDCLSDKSIMTPDKSMVRHPVLKQSVIKHESIFRVDHKYETIIIARLDAAESLLRRHFRGIKLERVALE